MSYYIPTPAPAGALNGPTERPWLHALEPLTALGAARRAELLPLFCVDRVPPGMSLFREGVRDDCTIYLMRGEIVLTVGGQEPARLIRAAHGVADDTDTLRFPLIDKQPRQCSAMTVSDVEISRIDCESLDLALLWDQLARRRGASPEFDVLTRVQRVLPMRAVPPTRIDDLFDRLRPMTVKAGQVIVRESDPAGDYFIIIQGRAAQIRKTDRGREAPILRLDAGAGFGEEALGTTTHYAASVAMTTPGRLWRLARTEYQALQHAPAPPWIEARETLAHTGRGRAQWLDVRHPSEHRHDRIPGSQLAPLQHLDRAAAELDRDVDYLCYCNTGRRAAAAAEILLARGLHATALRGGLQALAAP